MSLKFFVQNFSAKCKGMDGHADITSIPMYVINLRHRKDRLATFMKEIATSGLEAAAVTRFEAINSKAFNNDDIRQLLSTTAYLKLVQGGITRDSHEELTLGAVGCYASHLEVMRRFLLTNNKYCMIFEDDCVLKRNSAAHISRVFDKLKTNEPDFDMLLLGSLVPPPSDVYAHPSVQSDEYVRIQRFYGMHAYIVSRKGAERILKTGMPITQQIDSQVSDLSAADSIKVYLMVPMTAFQVGMSTDIQTPCTFCGPLTQSFVVHNHSSKKIVQHKQSNALWIALSLASLLLIAFAIRCARQNN